MNTRILTFLIALVLGIGVCALPCRADEEKSEKTEKKEVAKAKADSTKVKVTEKTEKKEVVKSKADSTKVKVSSSFLHRWKNIKQVTGKRAYATQKTRTVAGVRGAEADDAVLDQLYYKGGVRYPSRVDLKNAITQLWESIKADPMAETVPEQKFFIAQCHAQLGETKEAEEVYNDIVKNHPDTDSAKQAIEEFKKVAEK